jgi:hypothetical protein
LTGKIDLCGAKRMKRYAVGIFFMALSIMFAACSSSSPELDKRKFNGVGRAAQTVRSVLGAGADYKAFGAALQKLSAEITALKGGALTDQEKELMKDYSDLYSIYQDGYVLWKYKIEFIRYGFVPKGLIYVGQDIEPIIVKYRIPAESHMYAPTQQSWKSIPEESIQMIWTNADSQMQIINNILSY